MYEKLRNFEESKEPKHTGAGKMSKPQTQLTIPSTSLAFQPIQLGNTVERETISVSKERGRQEAVRMADSFQNPEKDQRQANINKPRQTR